MRGDRSPRRWRSPPSPPPPTTGEGRPRVAAAARGGKPGAARSRPGPAATSPHDASGRAPRTDARVQPMRQAAPRARPISTALGRKRRALAPHGLGLARAALCSSRARAGWGCLPSPCTSDLGCRQRRDAKAKPCPRLPQTWANVALAWRCGPGYSVRKRRGASTLPSRSREAPIPGRAGLRLSLGTETEKGSPVTGP